MTALHPIRLRVRPARPSAHAREVVVDPSLSEFVIGRGAGLPVELPFAVVSLRHARCYRCAGGWCIEDLGSVNGTWKGTRRLVPGRPEPLVPGELLRLGDVGIELLDPATAGDLVLDAGTDTLARQLVSDLFGSLPGQEGEVPTLEVIAGPDRGRRFALAARARPYRFGRGADCECVLTDPDCSRGHAAVVRRDDGIHVMDLRAKNGVLVDGVRIAGEALLQDGQELTLGATRLRLDDPEARYLERMRAEEQPQPAAVPQGAQALQPELPRTPAADPSTGVEVSGSTSAGAPVRGRGAGPAASPPVAIASKPAAPASGGWLVVLSVAVLAGLIAFALWLFV